MKIASDLIPDRLYMNVDSGSESGDDVPDLTSDTSDVSDMDHEQGHLLQVFKFIRTTCRGTSTPVRGSSSCKGFWGAESSAWGTCSSASWIN